MRPAPVSIAAWFFGIVLASGGAIPLPSPGTDTVQFNRDIRPILSDNCFACHGFDPNTRKSRLRLDTPEGAFGTGRSGEVAIRPGDPQGSEVWLRIATDNPNDIMPPPDSHKSLTAEQRELVRRWIEQGARYQQHWAFESPSATPPPADLTATHPIDRFIVADLRTRNLSLQPEADRPTLLRRLSFDLIGLPPTPAEVEAFLADTAPGAYERVVDRLLNSPHYGEQMARHWLDVARYADTHGLHLDNERSIWPYRDWVVNAFNRNLPFDQFTIEQLAGDLLPDPTLDQLVATGFNRNNVTTSEGGSIDAEFIFRYAVDRAATTAQAWMGLTAGCAVCHDHKFDPISAREFYSLYAFFHSSADPAMDGNIRLTKPFLRLKSPEDEARLAEYDELIAAARSRVAAALETIAYTDPATLDPAPPALDVENVWADDAIPEGWKISASPGAPPNFITASDSPVRPFRGDRALRRQDTGRAQDVIEAGPAPLEIPADARLFAHVYLDPNDLPQAIMLQYRTGEWKHRAIWGDYDAIDWGAANTTERVHQGPLPEAGIWVRLEVDASTLGLHRGDRVNGFALTQQGGTVYWDYIGVAGRIDPATDPTRSFLVWTRQFEGKAPRDLPENVRAIFKDTPADQRTEEQQRTLLHHFLSRVSADARPTFEPLLAAVADTRKKRETFEESLPATLVWSDLEDPRESFVMERGAYDRPAEKVEPGVPAFLPPLAPAGSRPTRLDLARWLVRDDHPLTARVTVNRFWQQFFGAGLVRTPDDFGSQGELPSHPELLDWLAVHFPQSGWDVKALVRLFVTSDAYRQSSRVTPELLQRDPENRWLARGPRFRLDAEQLRDNALFVSGLLVPDMGGPGVKPYQPPNIWEPVGFVGSNTREYRQDTGPALYRRSLYTFFKRTAPPPFMAAFDAPNREQSCSGRERSNTPLQALQLMNDVQHFEAARALAERMLVEGGSTPSDRLAFAYRVVLARPPAPEELEIVQHALTTHLHRYSLDPETASRVIHAGESQPRPDLPVHELAAYTLTANLLLNLDETLTRN
ncbi:MAG: PSD1 domain-containing protein [Verrucomicrobiae bacterium]|nr:PSD1 domain-containing protein [Verrucomicrobiae bacterium]